MGSVRALSGSVTQNDICPRIANGLCRGLCHLSLLSFFSRDRFFAPSGRCGKASGTPHRSSQDPHPAFLHPERCPDGSRDKTGHRGLRVPALRSAPADALPVAPAPPVVPHNTVRGYPPRPQRLSQSALDETTTGAVQKHFHFLAFLEPARADHPPWETPPGRRNKT